MQHAAQGVTVHGDGVGVSQARRPSADQRAGTRLFPRPGGRSSLGPGFAGDDERRGAAPVTVIGARLWRTMFGADPGVIGKTVQVNGLSATIVGVAPGSFTGFTRGQRVDVWLSTSQFFTLRHSPEDRLGDRHSSWLSLVGRTKPGVPAAQAHAQLTSVLHAAEGVTNAEYVIRTRPAGAGDISLVEDLGRPLRLLLRRGSFRDRRGQRRKTCPDASVHAAAGDRNAHGARREPLAASSGSC